MCFTIDRDYNFGEEQLAHEDIECYKALDVYEHVIKSPYQEVEYEMNVLYKAGLDFPDDEGAISEGLHSCKTIRECFEHSGHAFSAIIPKGSKYYENATQYVSDQLMVIEKVKSYIDGEGEEEVEPVEGDNIEQDNML